MKRCMGCMEQINDTEYVCPYCGFDENVTEEKLDILRIGSKLYNRYTIGKSLGRGGFGITYIAWDERLQRKVAIKEYMPRGLVTREPGTLTVKSDKEQKDGFEKGIKKTIEESRKLAGLSHLGSVVTVFDYFEENGTAYIVMELLEGQNVKQYITAKGKLDFDETIRIITPVLHTLSAVHKAGLIHRDISPDNIFLCNDGKVKLLDFGSARVAEDGNETSRSIILKHGYAPKEQYSSRGKQGAYTDMYAVSATLYKMLTGITPEESIERMTGEDELQDIAELVDIPSYAAFAIMQGLEIKEKDRIQTADEFLKRLTEEDRPFYTGDETVTMTEYAARKKYNIELNEAEQNIELQKASGSDEKDVLSESRKSYERSKEIKIKSEEKKSPAKKNKNAKSHQKKKKNGFGAKRTISIVAVVIVAVITVIGIIAKTAASSRKESYYYQALEYEKAGETFKAVSAYIKSDGYGDSVERLRNLHVFSTVSAGSAHTVSVKSDGTVAAAGYNEDGRCDVTDWSDVVSVSAWFHTVGLKSDGSVIATGINDHNECDVDNWTDIIAVSAGARHTVGLKPDGVVVATGNNDHGECNVDGWKNIVSVSAGANHTVGLKPDGTVVATGSNEYGECNVDNWTDIVAISAGADYTVGLKSDSTVVAVGSNYYGECDVSGWTDVVAISAGYDHTVGLKSDGTVVTAGLSDDERCDVEDWTNIVAISAGEWNTIGLISDGTVVSAGDNDWNQSNVSDWKNIKIP